MTQRGRTSTLSPSETLITPKKVSSCPPSILWSPLARLSVTYGLLPRSIVTVPKGKFGANQNRTAARTHACGGIEYLCVLRYHLGYFGRPLGTRLRNRRLPASNL